MLAQIAAGLGRGRLEVPWLMGAPYRHHRVLDERPRHVGEDADHDAGGPRRETDVDDGEQRIQDHALRGYSGYSGYSGFGGRDRRGSRNPGPRPDGGY